MFFVLHDQRGIDPSIARGGHSTDNPLVVEYSTILDSMKPQTSSMNKFYGEGADNKKSFRVLTGILIRGLIKRDTCDDSSSEKRAFADKGRNLNTVERKNGKCARKNEEQYRAASHGIVPRHIVSFTISAKPLSIAKGALRRYHRIVCFTLQACEMNYARARE